MKVEFNEAGEQKKAAAKAKLYARATMVVTLGLADVRHGEQQISVDEIREGFLKYLKENKIPHVIIQAEGPSITYATCPEQDEGEPKARAVVAGYFKQERAAALTMQAYFQEHTHGPITDLDADEQDMITSCEKQEVNRNIKRLRRTA